jgi:hypothetical protein
VNALELVNEVIRESGVDLDSLSSSDWASPTEPMQIKMKNWVQQAWTEIQAERRTWEFMNRYGSFTLYPRLYVELGNRATAPADNATFECDTTGATFTLIATTTLSGAWASGTAKAYLDYEDLDGTFKFDEYVNELTPTAADDKFKIMDFGSYDLDTQFSDLATAQDITFFIQSTGSSTEQDNETDFDLEKLQFVPWETWVDSYEGQMGAFGRPQYFTIKPNGHYDFWPRADKGYFIKFKYTAEPGEFAAYSDEPAISEYLQYAIVWKAVMFYAQFDRAADVERRAKQRYMFYKYLLDRDKKPPFTWPRNRFTRG